MARTPKSGNPLAHLLMRAWREREEAFAVASPSRNVKPRKGTTAPGPDTRERLLRARRLSQFAQVTHQRQRQPRTPRLHPASQAVAASRSFSRRVKKYHQRASAG
jgi:hypothetical protein